MLEHYGFQIADRKKIRLIIDTDTKNEADDQFAVAHALLSPKFCHAGLIAAHFGSERCEDSMEQSFRELEKLTGMMGADPGLLYRGAPHAMVRPDVPVESEGARRIVEEAMKEEECPLYVALLGPLTDLASAYLMEPRIAGRLTAVWIGGDAYPAGGMEYNLKNDITAANVVFGSGIPLWQIPKNVYKMMAVSLAELQYRVRPQGDVGRYLFDQLAARSLEDPNPMRTGETWVLGDTPAVGVLLYENSFEYHWREAPYITQDMTYVHRGQSRPIRVYDSVDSRLYLEDFYCKLALYAEAVSGGK